MASIKYTKAVAVKTSKVTKAEKPAPEYGDKSVQKAPRKFAPLGAAMQYGQRNLAPKKIK